MIVYVARGVGLGHQFVMQSVTWKATAETLIPASLFTSGLRVTGVRGLALAVFCTPGVYAISKRAVQSELGQTNGYTCVMSRVDCWFRTVFVLITCASASPYTHTHTHTHLRS